MKSRVGSDVSWESLTEICWGRGGTLASDEPAESQFLHLNNGTPALVPPPSQGQLD